MEEETKDLIRKKVLPKLAILGVVYLLLAGSIALISYLAGVISGKGSAVENIALFHQSITFFFKSVTGSDSKFLFPGPGDFLLVAVVLLYRKRWKVSLGLLIFAGLAYVYGQFLIEPASIAIYELSKTSPLGIVFECLFSAITAAVIIAVAFLPAATAVIEKCHWKVIVPCNLLLFWAQPLWILMSFFSFKKAVLIPKEKKAKAKASAASSRLWAQVHERESKKRKGFRKK